MPLIVQALCHSTLHRNAGDSFEHTPPRVGVSDEIEQAITNLNTNQTALWAGGFLSYPTDEADRLVVPRFTRSDSQLDASPTERLAVVTGVKAQPLS